jgi:Domain of unknown function (DUF4388)
MSVEGSLDLFKLPEILQIVAQQDKTGILTVQGENDIVAVSFLGGRIVAADSLNQAGDEALAQILLREGLLTDDQLQEIRTEQARTGGSLPSIAVEKAFLERQQILEALRLQYCELLELLLAWTTGDFKFYANDEVSYEDGLRPIDVQTLLLRSSVTFDAPMEELAEGPESELLELLEDFAEPEVPADVDLSQVYERLPSAKPVRVRAPDGEPSDDDDGFVLLTPTEQQISSRIDGQRSVADLIEDCGVDWRAAVAATERLEALGLVRRHRPPVAEFLQEEVFRPPDEMLEMPEMAPFEESRSRGFASRIDPDTLLAWGMPALAAAALVLLVGAYLRSPGDLLLPFPWQSKERAAFVAGQREALYTKADRAAKSHFLLHSQFPERLDALVRRHLLSPRDLRDVQGRDLYYGPWDVRYELAPAGPDGPLMDQGTSEAITGNFLLDLDFFTLEEGSAEQPLVLLD